MSPSSAAPAEVPPRAQAQGERAASAWRWAAGVTLAMGLAARLPWPAAAGTAVTCVFFAAVWLAVWRRSDEVVRSHGLSLGGLMMYERPPLREMLGAWGRSLLWALAMSAAVLVPFALLWRPVVTELHWTGLHAFEWRRSWGAWGQAAASQLCVVALPEEALYRGVLQTRFERSFPRGMPVLGGVITLGNVLTSVVFAVGHVVTRTDPVHLLVFFPSLLFGWLRTRTKSIESGMFFHAFCNLLSECLFEGFLG